MSDPWGPGLNEQSSQESPESDEPLAVQFHTGQLTPLDVDDGSDSEASQEAKGPPRLKIGEDYASVRRFLTTPLVKGVIFRTIITRQKEGFLGRYPLFNMRVDPSMGLTEKALIYAKKQPGNKTSNYHLGMDARALEATSKYYLGKVRANMLGTEFIIYDEGVSQKDAGSALRGDRKIRLELGAILFGVNVASATPREMTVILPETAREVGTIGILDRHRSNHDDGTFLLAQKKPNWSERTQTFNLNFHGRVKLPSVKNFILSYIGQKGIDNDAILEQPELEREALLFGKLDTKEQFVMDVRWPLSPIQAFAIAIASFDPKIACE